MDSSESPQSGAGKSTRSAVVISRMLATLLLVLFSAEISILAWMWTCNPETVPEIDFVVRICMSTFQLSLLIVVVLHIYFVFFKYGNSKLATDRTQKAARAGPFVLLVFQTIIRVLYAAWAGIGLAMGFQDQPQMEWIKPTMISFAIFGAAITIVALIVVIKCVEKLPLKEEPAAADQRLADAEQPKELIALPKPTQQVTAADEEKAALCEPINAVRGSEAVYAPF